MRHDQTMPKKHCQAALIWLFAGFGAAIAFSQDTPADAAKTERENWLKQRTLEFESYRFELEGLTSRKLVLETKAILDWSNPERGTFFGATFLWTYEGRPELIGDAYGRGQHLRHEFQSLSTEPISAGRRGNHLHRFKPGIQWHDLAGAPPPSKSSALRLTQMRRQAERFRVTVVTQKPNENEQAAPLRLLTQPVYRSPETSAADIGLFEYVQGTDPECALLVEITPEKQWRYTLARQTGAALKIELDGQQVLELPRLRPPPDPESSFLFLIPPEARGGN